MPDNHDISIIIPVLNEAAIINTLLEQIENLEYDDRPEIIVVDGDPQGSTVAAIRCSDLVKVISSRGRARQMNEGAESARGRIFLFLHADTQLPKRALKQIKSVMEEREVVAGAFDLDLGSDLFMLRLIARVASLRSRLTRVPFGDQAIFIRGDFFRAINGFDDVPLMEDVEIMRRIKKAGRRIVILPEAVRASTRRWEKEGILHCTVRNWFIQALYYLGVSPNWLVRFYKQG